MVNVCLPMLYYVPENKKGKEVRSLRF